MGYWLKQRLHTETKVAVDQTYRYKLPVTGFYSGFMIQVQDIRDGVRDEAGRVDFLHDRIDKIEFTTEGTKILKSFRGRECLALNLFDFKRPNEMQNSEEDDSRMIDDFFILAGRSLHDKKWMFDMSKLRDPELAITNSVDNLDGVDMDETVLEYQIFGWRWVGDPVPHPIGYMRADERLHYDTTAADVEKNVPITTGKKIRRILLMGWEPATTFYGHIKNIELQVDEGAYSPVIIPNIMAWCKQNKMEYGLDLRTKCEFYNDGSEALWDCDVQMCYPVAVHAAPYGTGEYTVLRIWDYDSGLVDLIATKAGTYELSADGYGYLTSLLIGFDMEADLADMLDTKGMASLRLLLIETGDGDTVSMVVEEEVLY